MPNANNDWSARELDVLRGMAAGQANRGIGERLGLAIETVRWYNKRIFARLNVTTRADAVEQARRLGLLDTRADADATPDPVAWSPIGFVDRDGCTLAYQVVGSGPVDVLFVHGFLSHLEVALDLPEYVRFFEALGRHARVLIFDKRGTGLSDRSHGAPAVEDTISDMLAVLDAVGSSRAVIMGTSEGGAAAVLFASMHPARTRSLVLIGSTARVARFGAEPTWSVPMAALDQSIAHWRATWGEPASIDRFAPSREHDPSFRKWWGRALRSASSPSSIRAVIEAAARVDVRAILPEVHAPALVLHRTDDRIVPVGAGRYLAERLPHARYVELPGADHIYFVDGGPVLQAIVPFLLSPDDSAVPASWLAIMLQMSGPGGLLTDEKQAILSATGARHWRENDTGWTVLFDGSARALACARRLAALGRGRVGSIVLHVGECATESGRPLGSARAVMNTLAHDTAAGEITLSTTLYDILNGEPLTVTPRLSTDAAGASGLVSSWRLQPA
jgi:pimeloyl-ACP methyl ester carboxylesterase/DNA-binding CsgD family transcriptional regulator